MIYLTGYKDELIQIVNIIMKFPASKSSFVNMITKKYQENQSDYDTAITYAFYHYYEITTILQGDDLTHSGAGQILQIYDSMQNMQGDDWFVHILKIFLLRKLVSYAASREDLIIEIEKVIELQTNAAKKAEYFIIPFIILSELHLQEENHGQAESELERGLELSKQDPIAYSGLSVHFKMVLQDIRCLMKDKKADKYKNRLEQINKIYFEK